MTGSKFAAVLLIAAGAMLSLVGLMTGFLPHSFGDISCGSAFAPDQYATYNECFSATDSGRTLALVLLVPGVILSVVGLCMALAGSGMFRQPTLAELEARTKTDA